MADEFEALLAEAVDACVADHAAIEDLRRAQTVRSAAANAWISALAAVLRASPPEVDAWKLRQSILGKAKQARAAKGDDDGR